MPGQEPRHPADVLLLEFLEPQGLTQTELARRLGVPFQRVNQIVNRKRAITPDTAVRLARVLGTTAEYWLELQSRWELSQIDDPDTGRTRRTRSPQAMMVRESAPALAPPTILDEIVDRIVAAVDPETIVLFGSSVDRPDAGSDIDLLVVEREPFGLERSRRQELRRIRQALAGLGIAKDILLFSTEEVERWRESPNHVVARALRQGRILHARS